MPVPSLAELLRADRPDPAEPARIGRHDVLVERGFGTFVYEIRRDRALMTMANEGYRDDVAAALLDAVDGLADGDFGATVRVVPIDVPGFALDRAALVGPGHAPFFRDTPLADRGVQIIPVHRSEAADGEDIAVFHPAVIGKNLGFRYHDWTRAPVPRAAVRRLDTRPGGPYDRFRSRRGTAKPGLTSAATVLGNHVPRLAEGVRLSVSDVRGYELRLHREWDRVRGTLHAPGRTDATAVDLPRHAAMEVFGPLFAGGDPAPPAAHAPEFLLMLRVYESRRRIDTDRPASLEECLRWLETLEPADGNFLVCTGRGGGTVQMRYEGAGEPRLWLETPEPAHRRSRGRHVTRDEAATMVEALARHDRVAVDDLGELTTVPWPPPAE